ncbi:MAG: hypothetical protein ACXW1P_01950 [Methylophilaceae bacterium]
MWRKLRIAILLFVLATVAHRTWLESQHLDWKKSLYVAVYPINMDGSDAAAKYIATLDADHFDEIAIYAAEEATRYGLALRRPFEMRLAPKVDALPPQPKEQASMLQTVMWSLSFRWWAYKNSPPIAVPPDIKLYLLYFDPATHPALPHSTALSKGRVGLVNVFADKSYARQNNVVVAHELLHTVGATDKYDLSNNQPAYPAGFAEPEKSPRYPQDFAELMAGRIPLSESKAEIPRNLAQTLIGGLTAREIGWVKK